MKIGILTTLLKKLPISFGFTDTYSNYFGQEVSDIIQEQLENDSPALICKIGYTELNCILSCTNLVAGNFSFIKLVLKVATNAQKKIAQKSGFFPNDKDNIVRFSQLLLEDMGQIDILGTWLKHEKYIRKYISNAKKVKASDLEPFFHKAPWTKALENKTVLVIHPFETTITHQFNKKARLFENKNILPEFQLKTLRAVQSRENNTVKYDSWWDAFEYMKNEIDKIEFDIAILGCGSYSLPLGAHIKRSGKKAIHLGGSTQLLFGIKGSRWEEREKYSKLFNSDWTKPLSDDVPVNITKSDSYW